MFPWKLVLASRRPGSMSSGISLLTLNWNHSRSHSPMETSLMSSAAACAPCTRARIHDDRSQWVSTLKMWDSMPRPVPVRVANTRSDPWAGDPRALPEWTSLRGDMCEGTVSSSTWIIVSVKLLLLSMTLTRLVRALSEDEGMHIIEVNTNNLVTVSFHFCSLFLLKHVYRSVSLCTVQYLGYIDACYDCILQKAKRDCVEII